MALSCLNLRASVGFVKSKPREPLGITLPSDEVSLSIVVCKRTISFLLPGDMKSDIPFDKSDISSTGSCPFLYNAAVPKTPIFVPRSATDNIRPPGDCLDFAKSPRGIPSSIASPTLRRQACRASSNFAKYSGSCLSNVLSIRLANPLNMRARLESPASS